ncbi:MAG TPA: SGNH/GDSL hydrolase family protein, partial [Myxococcota bacterium]|nr:SGNH/GDSL hydrolase family protein [Myxococcota bacterium]
MVSGPADDPNDALPAGDANMFKVEPFDALLDLDGGPYFFGRFSFDEASATFAWPGSSIFARFTGTGISVALQEMSAQVSYSGSGPQGNYYDVIVDGNDPNPLTTQTGLGTYVLAQNLKEGEHTVLLRKRTEALVGAARFMGFTVAGAPLAAPAKTFLTRRIEVIGDSISAGYGVEGLSAQCPFTPATENVSRSYAFLMAKNLKADVHVVAWSGKGVGRNADGSTAETMPELYRRTLPSDANSVWNFANWGSQVVVVNLGTNDFAQGTPSALAFQGAYATLLADLRGRYPKALIFCVLGPMLSDAFPEGAKHLTTARAYIKSVVDNAGD